MIDPRLLVGIAEIAEMGKVTRTAVSNWRYRYPDFPTPLKTLACGPVFDADDVMEWMAKYDRWK